jgi:hypothetical protein
MEDAILNRRSNIINDINVYGGFHYVPVIIQSAQTY